MPACRCYAQDSEQAVFLSITSLHSCSFLHQCSYSVDCASLPSCLPQPTCPFDAADALNFPAQRYSSWPGLMDSLQECSTTAEVQVSLLRLE